MKLSDVYEKPDRRECVICGETDALKRFITDFRGRLNISAVVTNDYEEIEHQPYLSEYGISAIPFEIENCRDRLVIICSKYSKNETYLKQLGQKEYSDFVSARIIDAWLSSKDISLIMGTELLRQVSFFLALSDGYAERYSTVFFADNSLRSNSVLEAEDMYDEYVHIGRWADVYIHSSTEKEGHFNKQLKKEQLKENCRIISVSDHGFRAYFPQFKEKRNEYGNYFFRELDRLDMNYLTLAGARTDTVVEGLLKEGKNEDETADAVLNRRGVFFSGIEDLLTNEIVRVRTSEKDDDIRLADFIEANVHNNLCRNLDEWNEPVVSHVSGEILKRLNVSSLTTDISERQALIDRTSGCEAYVYPDIENDLGIKAKDRYKVVTFYNTYILRREEYVRFIVRQMALAMEMIDLTGFIPTNR